MAAAGRDEIEALARTAEHGWPDRFADRATAALTGEHFQAREFFNTQRNKGKKHHAALRALGNRWLEILWHCLTKNTPYDEAVHVANRNRAFGRSDELKQAA